MLIFARVPEEDEINCVVRGGAEEERNLKGRESAIRRARTEEVRRPNNINTCTRD